MFQKALKVKVDGIMGKKTVKAWQKKIGATQDGAWGENTSRKSQSFLRIKQDGEFGIASIRALQKWCNEQVFKTVEKPVEKPEQKPKKKKNGQKLADEGVRLAWAYGTKRKKYDFKTGNPKKVCKEAMAKFGYKSRTAQSDCGFFINTVVRNTGVDKKFRSLAGTNEKFPKAGKHFTIPIHGRKVKKSELKAGDIIRYKKDSGQHVLMYVGHGKCVEAGRNTRFARTIKKDKWNASNVKHKTIQVLRAKG